MYALVYLGFATSTRASAFVGWFLLYGVYFALAEAPAKALVTDLAPTGGRGTAFGVYDATLDLGALAASVLFGYLYEHFDASTAFATGALLACVAAVMLAFVASDPRRRSE